ncbi:MAG: glutamyl-tRNA synthetase, partial [Chitinophagaceae bacterium]|nr:glutamyl-tRNA synthetase [Chitinophagaceae bacterium]
FDYEKAKWYNHEWIKRSDSAKLLPYIKQVLNSAGIYAEDETRLSKVIDLVKERCTLLNDFVSQSIFFFQTPANIDIDSVKPKWDDKKNTFFNEFKEALNKSESWTGPEIENIFKSLSADKQIKAGELMLPFRIMLVGGKFGPGVFDIAALIGKEETITRINNFIRLLE